MPTEHKTGSIQILAPGPCGNPGLAVPFIPEFTNGDGVRIETRIEAPGYYTGQGLPPEGKVRDTVEAVAKKVWPRREQVARFQNLVRMQKEFFMILRKGYADTRGKSRKCPHVLL